MEQKKVLSFDEGCKFLGFKKSYCYKLVATKVLPHSKPNNGRIFFDREKLEEWMLGTPIEQKGGRNE